MAYFFWATLYTDANVNTEQWAPMCSLSSRYVSKEVKRSIIVSEMTDHCACTPGDFGKNGGKDRCSDVFQKQLVTAPT